MQLITTTDALAGLCERLKAAPFLTIDTEFMRERTYYSQLCLIQVASEDEAAIIDPLAPDIDLAPLLALMKNPAITKVFHAARQDIEIFYQLIDAVPMPIFDTQVAAMACGHGDQIGYDSLVRAVTGVSIDKGSQFTDWSRRPLTDKQLTYALGDVTHLIHVYKALVDELTKTGRLDWVAEEMDGLTNPSLYHTLPEQAWQRLKLRNVKPRELGPLMKLAEWREKEAQSRNLPRNRILKDDGLYEIARAAPSSRSDLGRLRAVPKGFEQSRYADRVLQAVAKGAEIDRDDLPRRERSGRHTPPPGDVIELLRVLLKRQCEHHNVAPKLLATAADLEAIAISDEADVPAMRGWRREVFGNQALKLKHGKLALGLHEERVKMIDTGGDNVAD